MPIFYTDNPLNVTASTGLAVTATVANPVTITGQWSGSAIPVTSSISFPVWITGNISTGPSTTPDAYITGATFPSSGSLTLLVSGANNTTVFGRVGTGTMASGILVTLASDQPDRVVDQGSAWSTLVSGTVGASQSAGWAVQVSSSVAVPVYVQTTGNLLVATGTMPVVVVTSALASPVWIASTGALVVSQSNTQLVSQFSAWGAAVSGVVGVTNSGAFSTFVSGIVGVTNSGAFSAFVSGVVGVQQSGAFTVQVSGTSGAPVFVATTGNLLVQAAQNGAWTVQVSGAMTASTDKSTTANLTTIEVGNASTVLLTASNVRKGATIFSLDSTVFIALGQTPTTTLYGAKVPSSSYYEVPFNWQGAVNAIAAASGQTVNIQEFYA